VDGDRYRTAMTVVERAGTEDIEQLVELESALFREDAGVHERYADITWPEREGRGDFERLMADPNSFVLVGRDGHDAVGFLVGYLTPSSPSRQPVTYAVLRSLYVHPQHRGTGTAGMLTDRFLAWAREHRCVEAHVDAYTANERAQRFYERHGFTSQSISRVHSL